jgi:peptide deformylase
MSDILTINTEQNIVKQQIESLPLYDEKFHMLNDEIPEYTDVLPNPIMTNLIQRMKFTMKKFGGLGLSANQCGVYERVFVIGYGDNVFACINPKIKSRSIESVKEKEGCLSYPGMYLSIPRSKWIEVEYTDESGNLVNTKFEGITARCFLHELDHMNGIRFTDLVGPVAIRMAKQKQLKSLKKYQRQFKNKSSEFYNFQFTD